MPTFRIDPSQLGALFRQQAAAQPAVLHKGAIRGAAHGAAVMPKRSPVDLGFLAASWHLDMTPGAVSVYNDAPYAGIMERGARPHKTSREARDALYAWVVRHLDYFVAGDIGEMTPERTHIIARRITWGITVHWERYGREGTFFVRDSLPMLRKLSAEAMRAEIIEFFTKPPTGLPPAAPVKKR